METPISRPSSFGQDFHLCREYGMTHDLNFNLHGRILRMCAYAVTACQVSRGYTKQTPETKSIAHHFRDAKPLKGVFFTWVSQNVRCNPEQPAPLPHDNRRTTSRWPLLNAAVRAVARRRAFAPSFMAKSLQVPDSSSNRTTSRSMKRAVAPSFLARSL